MDKAASGGNISIHFNIERAEGEFAAALTTLLFVVGLVTLSQCACTCNVTVCNVSVSYVVRQLVPSCSFC